MNSHERPSAITQAMTTIGRLRSSGFCYFHKKLNCSALCLSLSAVILVGCHQQPAGPALTVTPPVPPPQASQPETPEAMLAKAQTVSSPERERLILAVARHYVEHQQMVLAVSLLDNLSIDALPLAEQIEFKQLNALIHEANGHYLAAARERVMISGQLDESSQQENNEAIWRDLNQLPVETLEALLETLPDLALKAWIELALINKQSASSLETQYNQVRQWMLQWPHHMAAQHMPESLNALKEAVENRPTRIAVLLPESGRYAQAAQAIRQGIMLAYYSARTQEDSVPEIHFFDTTAEPVQQVYLRAIDSGAQVVIGPLDKSKVAELAALERLSVPTLALNYLADAEQPAPGSLVQFGLAAEDEAIQISERARREGHAVAAVIYPDTEWGQRVSAAFTDHWLASGGDLAVASTYTGDHDYTNIIKQMLAVDRSELRARQLRQWLGVSLEFSPRRRQDIDFIVALGNFVQARQIKPVLDYYFAGDLPVFSTSNIYSGRVNPDKDKDLNNMEFVDLPWMFDNSKEMTRMRRQASSKFPRLVALGVDAFRLYPRLKLLTANENAYFEGATGQLTMDASGYIRRRLMWARFDQGRPVVVVIKEPSVEMPIDDDV